MKKLMQKILSTGADLSTKKALKRTIKFLGIKADNIDKLYVELKNDMHRKRFRSIDPKDKLIFLPQCLRKKSCEAPLDKDGFRCVECKNSTRCKVFKIRSIAEPKGYRVFVVPGGSMVTKLIAKYRPKAVLGVGCLNELVMACEEIPLPTQGVELLRDGCVETDVNIAEVRRML